MIKIKEICIGNSEEAFVENRFSDGINLIYSYENNKGKTIISQSIYHTLGHNAIFPTGFEHKNYYFVLSILVNNEPIIICRRDKTFVVKKNNHMQLFNTVSEFKRFFSTNIFKLPIIIKDGFSKIVDPELFVQLFMVNQDKRNTSNIINNDYYKKADFENMIYSMMNCHNFSDTDQEKIYKKIKDLSEQKQTLLKKDKVLKDMVSSVSIASYIKNKEEIDKKLKLFDDKTNELNEYKKQLNKARIIKTKNEALLKELNSLNRELKEGQLKCLECSSTKIGFEDANKSFAFEISDNDIRNNIKELINNRIEIANEDVNTLTQKIYLLQQELREIMTDPDVSSENLLLYKDEVKSIENLDREVYELDTTINELKTKLDLLNKNIEKEINSKKSIMGSIIHEIQLAYKKIDPDSKLEPDALFSGRTQVYSGSEGAEFDIAKIYAFAKILKHPFPIIIDAFRAGEISTSKEGTILQMFSELSNQMIFTTSLKKEEQNKYDNIDFINAINYESHTPSHILNKQDLPKFKEAISEIKILL